MRSYLSFKAVKEAIGRELECGYMPDIWELFEHLDELNRLLVWYFKLRA